MADQVVAIMAGLDAFTEEQVIGLTLDITANLQLATPVDTGWARANWVPSVASPAWGVPEVKGKPSPAAVSAARGRQQAGVDAVLGYTLDKGSCWVSNGVDYIQALNAGHSRQAPAAFVQKVVAQTIVFSEHSAEKMISRSSFDYRPGL